MSPDTRRGVLAMVAGVASFAGNDALTKHAGQTLPPSQLIFLRAAFAAVLLLAVARAMGATAKLAALGDRRIVLRSGLDALGSAAWVTSIAFLPLANVTAIGMGMPLIMALMAVFGLQEQLGARRWLAIATGFAGVLLVVQPAGESFNVWSLLCLSSVILFSGRDLMTRLVRPDIPSVLITLASVVAAMFLSAGWGAFQGWVPITVMQLAVVAGAATFMAGGVFLLTVAMRAGEIGVIAPFRYAGLLFASVLGFALWGDVPNSLACVGMLLLVAAGLTVARSR